MNGLSASSRSAYLTSILWSPLRDTQKNNTCTCTRQKRKSLGSQAPPHLSERSRIYIQLYSMSKIVQQTKQLRSNPQMNNIVAYLQRKSVNYDIFMLFETERPHFENLANYGYWAGQLLA